jgi:DNA-binding GntR family transcriptional regulator
LGGLSDPTDRLVQGGNTDGLRFKIRGLHRSIDVTDADRIAQRAIPEGVAPEPVIPLVRGSGRTLAEELRWQLADEIVRGTLAPGTALDETELARRFQVSRTPVREAIRQLAASGLIETRAHRGSVVAQPSHEHLIGMFEAMAELEALCAGLAATRITPAERHALGMAHEELRAMIQSGDPQRYHEINEAFHSTIYAGAHNSYLAEITLATRIRVRPFRRAQFRNLGRLAKSHTEHDLVVTAIMRGDREGAMRAMRDHIITVRVEYEMYALSLSSASRA